jgi:hypothetical protein
MIAEVLTERIEGIALGLKCAIACNGLCVSTSEVMVPLAIRVIGPWPEGPRMLIFPLGDNWRATFSLGHSAIADYRR